jgi:hypothetical protein
MDRRGFLNGLVGTALGFLEPGCSRVIVLDASLTINNDDAGRLIPPDFKGLSYESSILASGDYFAPDNASVVGLIRSLGDNGIIRIGGNTSERTVWRPESKPGPDDFEITPASIDRLAATLSILGWRLIYGLNLARGTPQAAADEAAYVAQAIGPQLLAFQIGNEPEGFGRWNKARSPGYNVDAFLADWRRFHAAIRSRIPAARFAGPDVMFDPEWVGRFAAMRPDGLILLTQHYYADGPAGSRHVSLPRLLRSDQQAVPVLEKLAEYGRNYRLPFRLVEANSIYNEGQPCVSDTLGAALWGLELMFQTAAAGGAGINFHAGANNHRPAEDKAYSPIARAAGGRYRAMPLYYGMLAFAAAAKGVLVQARLEPSRPNLSAFAVRADDGSLRLCLINKNVGRRERIKVNPNGRFANASILRLAGPGIDATTNVTLGGAAVDQNGSWDPVLEEARDFDGTEFVVEVAASSAAVITLVPKERRTSFAPHSMRVDPPCRHVGRTKTD